VRLVLDAIDSVARMVQAISIVGAILILAAYAGNQLKALDSSTALYVILNLVGAAILAAVAALEDQWGFLLLEGVWTLIAAFAAIRLISRGTV
jgi:hypothetical protein